MVQENEEGDFIEGLGRETEEKDERSECTDGARGKRK